MVRGPNGKRPKWASEKRTTVLLAKLGLDFHTRGIKLVAALLRDAGMEVVYLGPFQTAEGIAKAAVEEDVDVIGVSCLSGEHLKLVPKLINCLEKEKAGHLPVVVGGIIPREDIPVLKNLGIYDVFISGATAEQIIQSVTRAAERERGPA